MINDLFIQVLQYTYPQDTAGLMFTDSLTYLESERTRRLLYVDSSGKLTKLTHDLFERLYTETDYDFLKEGMAKKLIEKQNFRSGWELFKYLMNTHGTKIKMPFELIYKIYTKYLYNNIAYSESPYFGSFEYTTKPCDDVMIHNIFRLLAYNKHHFTELQYQTRNGARHVYSCSSTMNSTIPQWRYLEDLVWDLGCYRKYFKRFVLKELLDKFN